MKAGKLQPIRSTFPLFALDVKQSEVVIGGGGGSARSGVPNKIQWYDLEKLMGECDMGTELVNAVRMIPQRQLIAVTKRSLKLIAMSSVMTVTDSIDLEGESQSQCFCEDVCTVAVGSKLAHYKASGGKLNLLGTQEIEDVSKIQKVFSFVVPEGAEFVVLTKEDVLVVKKPVFTQGITHEKTAKQMLEMPYPNHAIQYSTELMLLVQIQPRTKKTKLYLVNRKHEIEQQHEIGGIVANVCINNEVLYLLFSDGVLGFYTLSFKKLLRTQTKMTELHTNLCVRDQHAVVMSVDGFQEIYVSPKNRDALKTMLLSIFLVSFLYLLFA